MKRGKRKVNWERVWLYILAITVIVLVFSNYKLQFSKGFNEEFNEYSTKIELVRK